MKRFTRVWVLLALAACTKAQTHDSIAVSGVMTPIGAASASGTSFTLYGAQDLITGAAPAALGQASVSDGGWAVAPVDVTTVDDALVAVTDGTDALLPTLSGVVDYSSGAAKADLTTGRLFVVSRALATRYASAMGRPELLTQGFVMGLVSDGVSPMAGATVKSASALTLEVWYPSADLTTLSRTQTSAAGLFVIPADPAYLFVDLIAEKTGHSFAKTLAPVKSGLCSFAVVLPSVAASPLDVGISGVVTAIGTASAAGASLSAIAPYDFTTSTAPAALDTAVVADGGTFALPQVDVTNVSQGLLAKVTGDAFFPTVSGLTAWASEADSDKQGTSSAHVFAVSKTLAQALATGLGKPAMLTEGFIMGIVTDGASPVAGATLSRVDGQSLAVIYPDSSFSTFTSKQTSASGIFILAPDTSLPFAEIVATKTGWSFASATLLLEPGTCFFPAIVPAAVHAPITVDVAGLVTPIGVSSAAGVTVSALAPYDVATSSTPTALGSTTASAAGTFALSAVPVTNVSQGLLAEVTGSAFFPTVSGVTAWTSEADASKKGTSSAHLFAVSKVLAQTLAAGLGKPELLTNGFVMGLVTDGAAPVAGATISRVDGKAVTVIYPDASLTSLAGTQTSANGLFILAPDASLESAAIVATKTGWTFAPSTVLLSPGACFFAAIVPAAVHAPITVDVAGVISAIPTASASGATVSALAPYDYLTSSSMSPLGTATASATNGFSLTSVPVTNVSQGLLAEVTGDAFYPTVSGVTAWASEADADKKLASPAVLFAVSKTLVQGLSAALSPTLLTDGFIMGMVTNGTAPVSGATVARADGKAMTVLYPDATFTSLSGTSTSANGLFIVLASPSVQLTPVVATKTGSTFAPALIMERPGTCFFVAIHP